MKPTRSFLFAATCALPLAMAACGSDDKTTQTPDAAGGGDGGGGTPQGTHSQYVVDQASVPSSQAEVAEFGVDLGGEKSSKLDGTPDNQLGVVFFTLAGIAKFPIQDTITQSVDTGKINLLVDVQATDTQNASNAGLSVKIGKSSTPPACADATDTTCRHQFDGTAMFAIDTTVADHPAITGSIVNGTFKAGPGPLTLQIALGSTDPITLNLLNARVEATAITAGGMTAKIGGGVLAADLNNNLLPAVAAQLGPIVVRDCGTGGAPPSCGCADNSTGALIITNFDNSPKDCQVTLDEVKNNGLVTQLLSPDLCTKDSCDASDAVSFGIKVHAVKASF